MTKLLPIVFLLFCFQLKAQDSLSVDFYLNQKHTVYPYPEEINNFYYWNTQFQYEQDENGLIITNKNYDSAYISYTSREKQYQQIINNFIEFNDFNFDIPPLLDSLPNGIYIRYFKSIPYNDADTIKYLKNKVSSIFHIENNILHGRVIWFSPIEQIPFKKGFYKNGKKEGEWSMKTSFEENLTLKKRKEGKNTNKIKFYKPIPYTTFNETKCTFKNGYLHGIETTKFYDPSIKDTITFIYNYNLGVKEGAYFHSLNKIILSQGNYKNDMPSGEWFFYNWKLHKPKSKFKYDIENRILIEHFKVNDELLNGNSPVIRLNYENLPVNHDNSSKHYDPFYYNNKNRKEIMPTFLNNSFNFYYRLFVKNESKLFNVLIPFNGGGQYIHYNNIYTNYYTFNFNEYERYYPNGQLFLKFKTVNGNLERENDTIFRENGLPMNIVNYFDDRKEYEQKFIDTLGNLEQHILFNAQGHQIKILFPAELTVKIDTMRIIEGNTYIAEENYQYNIKNEIKTYRLNDEISLKDQDSVYLTGKYDEKTSSIISKTTYFPKKHKGTITKTIEEKFAYLNAIFQLDTILKTNNYSEIITMGQLSFRYSKKDTLNVNNCYYSNYNKLIDTSNQQIKYNSYYLDLADFNNSKNGSTLFYRNKPFTGNLFLHLHSSFQKVIKTTTGIHIYLSKKENHEVLLNQLLRPLTYYIPTKITKETLDPFNNFKESNTVFPEKFYNATLIKIPLKNGLFEGETTIKNGFDSILANISFTENEINGSVEIYSYYPQFRYYNSNGHLGFNPSEPIYFMSEKNEFLHSNNYHYSISFDKNNDTINIGNYKYGRPTGINSKFTFNKITKTKYDEGLKNGKEIICDSNHIVLADLNYENNELNGEAFFYFTSGSLFQKAKFKNGKLIDSLFVYKLDKTLDKIILYDTNYFQKEMIFQNGKAVKEVTNNTTQVRSLIYCVNTSNSQPNDSTITTEVCMFYEQNRYPNPYNKLIHSHFTEEQFNNSPYKTIAAVSEYFSDLIPLEIDCYTKEFDENGKILKEGAFGKSKFHSYSAIKIGLWKYNPPYQNSYTVFYHDTLVKINDSLSFNSKGIFTDLDAAGIPISKRHIIEDQQLYNCGQNETYDINTYYVIYEKDSSQHLINGFVKYYYTNGVKQSEGINKNGLPTGIWKYYNDNGSLREIGRYINGEKHGRWLSGDLSKFAYLGDVCLDMKNPEQEELQKILENRLRINETYFENGKITLRNYFEINK